MRITTRLRIISTATIAALVVLAPVLIWSFIEFEGAKKDYALAEAIKVNFFERTSFRDQYFLYREDRARVLWEKNREMADRLLLQAKAQFHIEDQQDLERLHKNIEDSAIIFQRIVNNTEVLRSATGNRHIYEELDKRLFSQLLLKAIAVRDTSTALQDTSARRVEQAYKHLTIIMGLFAVMLAFATILISGQIGKLIRKRLAPLHDGAIIVADGNLDYRIQCDGTDEFAELARSINAMTGKLQAFTGQLEAEIAERKQAADALARSRAELQRFAEISAHHLQEPARRIASYAERLTAQLAGRLDDAQTNLSLEYIGQQARRQQNLLHDIERYLAASQPRGELKDIDTQRAVVEILEKMAERISEAGAEVTLSDLPAAHIDAPRLKDLFTVALDNAFNFGCSERPLRIVIAGERQGDYVRYSISDNGPGVETEYRERVFRVFERLTATNEGTGIGLAILRRVAESTGGHAWIEETPGGGCRVLFEVPAGELS